MDTPGKIFKAEREKQGKSLKEISVNLKLSIDYLTAIEEDNYSKLPAEVFIKAYLRLYADELGIDGDHILDLFYELGKEDIYEKAAMSETKAERSSRKIIKSVLNTLSALVNKIKFALIIDPASLRKLKPSININFGLIRRLKPSVKMDFAFIKMAAPLMISRKSLLTAIAVVVAAVLFAIVTIDSDKTVPDKTAADRQTAPGKTVPDKTAADRRIAPGKTSGNEDKALKPVEKIKVNSEKKKKKVEEKISEKLVLEIIAEELTWASVSIDGGEFKEMMLRAGEAVTIRAEDNFNLKIGNAGGTKLVLNGKKLGKLGPYGKVVNIKLP